MRFRASFNPEPLKTKLQNRSRGFAGDLREELRRTGRLVALSLARSAVPYGIDEAARKSGEIATARDIRKCYATPGQVFEAFPDKHKAADFWRAIKAGNFARAQKIMQADCPKFHNKEIKPFDGGAAHRANRNKRGRVSPKQEPVFVVQTTRDLTAYVNKEVDQVGFGKAGWANCGKALGGTRGLSEKDVSAQWITRHKKAPASVIEDTSNPERMTVTLINNVDYAENLLDESTKREAIGIGIDRLTKSIFEAERRTARANALS